MSASICVPETMTESFRNFITSEGISVDVASEGDQTVRIVRAEGKVESDLTTLQSGGWIRCEVARAMAERLGISYQEVGRILDFLSVKVRQCELGCF